MATRNTPLLGEIVEVLRLGEPALAQLEEHFRYRYVLNAGGVEDVASFAATLRLEITAGECQRVLDQIAEKALVGVTLDQVEESVFELLGNRFLEPGE